MKKAWTVWLALLLQKASAGDVRKAVRVRGSPLPYYNTSIASTSSTETEPAGISGTLSGSIQASDGSNPESQPTRPPSVNPTGDVISQSADCVDSVVTYTGEVPTTVYVTVAGSYEVTVTASNVSIPAFTIYETPAQACYTTVVPGNMTEGLLNPQLTTPLSPSTSPRPPPPNPTKPSGSGPKFSFAASSPDAQGAYRQTSTVVVTKKTAVTVIDPTATPSLLSFGSLKKTDIDGQGISSPSTNPQEVVEPTGEPSGGGYVPNASPTEGNGAQPTDDGTSGLSAIESVVGGIASIIDSVINSPFAVSPTVPSPNLASPTPGFVATPTTYNIAGVVFSVGPSNVVVGSETVALPTSSQTTIVVASQTFTINPSQIFGPSTTVDLETQNAAPSTITQAPSVVTAAGITFTVGASVAVISGTTYRVGTGALPTSVIVNGQTVSIGPAGVAVSGSTPTTFAPAMTIAGGFELIITDGLTVSVDQSEAIISGTTYQIGAGAPTTIVDVGGTSITIGPSGVVLPSTTITPVIVPTTTVFSASNSRGTTQTTSNMSAAARNLGISVQPLDILMPIPYLWALLPLLCFFI